MATPQVIEIPLPQLQVPTTANSAPPLISANPSLVPPPPNLLASFSSPPPANANSAFPQKAVAVEVAPDQLQKSASDGATSSHPVPLPAADAEPSATFVDLFRFASAGDKIMVGFAFFLAILHGACLPAFSYVFGEFMDTTGSVSPDELLDRVSFLAGIMVAIGAFAFVAAGLWTALFAYSSQRQGARIRTIYLASIIGKDCAWCVLFHVRLSCIELFFDIFCCRFDSVTPAEIPTRMNEEISKIQRAIGHQLGTGTMNASMFILGVLLGLVRGWQVALIVCSAMPLIGLSSGALGFFMSQKDKVQMDAYASSGAVAEEVCKINAALLLFFYI
jgi:ABC-type multidrug transport system fused ATPase/permease subunit